jgi:hypothetical protein
MVLHEPKRREVDAAVGGIDDIAACQSELLACFEATYGTHGGYPLRHETYWEQQLVSQIYVVIPQQFLLIRHPAQGPLIGYVIASIRREEGRDRDTRIIEVAGLNETAIEQALLGFEDLAAQRGKTAHVHASAEHPCLSLFRRLGYNEGLRTTMIMAQPVDPPALARKVCQSAELLDDLKIDFWAPFADGSLHEGPNARVEVTLEGKDDVIYRLLSLRLDVRAAYQTEWLTVRGGTSDIVDRIGQAFPYAPWVYHHIDYV